MTPLIEGRDLTFSVAGRVLFSGLSLSVSAGERLAVVGPSGSGKTSLLALLSGLARPDSGEVLIDGEPLEAVATPSAGVSIVLQGYGLVSLLTAAENVEVALRAAGRAPRQAAGLAQQALADVGLAAHAHQLAEELSGGQQQRTAVARALALEPRVLIADEPTAELDPASRARTLARMLATTDRGAALVLATHDPDVAERCHRILDLRSTLVPGG